MKVLVTALLLAGCVDHQDGISGTQSLQITLDSPASPGTPDARLDDTARTVKISVTAKDADGNVDTTYTHEVQVYAQFLGTLTPSLGAVTPLARIDVVNGVAASATVTLPPVFGPTTLWIDDGDDDAPTFATGTSPTLWYRDPTIEDCQKPLDEMGLGALTDSPLENKTVAVGSSRYGSKGRMVVTSVFSQGYTVSDSQCADDKGTPPCLSGDYDHIEIFSFSAPQDQMSRPIQVGQFIDGFAGGISEFNGLTEVGFPQSFVSSEPTVDLARLSPPKKLQAGRTALGETTNWFGPISGADGMINFERNEAAPIEIDSAVVCALDSDYTTYKQWKIDPNGTPGAGVDCSHNKNIINVITSGVITDFDPSTDGDQGPEVLVGKQLTKLIGVLRPVEIGSFNVWLVYPRSIADVVQ